MSHSDDLRKADFREIARRIVVDARDRRKYHINGDTTGTIARALERAYQRGRREEREGVPAVDAPTDHLEWKTIPPKPRSAFWGICLAALGEDQTTTRPGTWHLVFEERRQNSGRWVLYHDGCATDRTLSEWGDRTIRPLITRGLLAWADNCQLTLTDLATKTWWAALKSVDTSPIELVGTLPSNEWAL